MDILTSNGRSIVRNDFSSNWDNSPKLGKVEAGDDFLINGSLGGTRSIWNIRPSSYNLHRVDMD